jgi:AraC family transcriptional regulator
MTLHQPLLLRTPSARIGVRVDMRTTAPGRVELEGVDDHRVRIHVGNPVRGACSVHKFLYSRGDIDIHPAGYADVWEEFDTNTSMVLRLTPSLLRSAAEEIGVDSMHTGLEPRHQFQDPQIEHIAWALDAERRGGDRNGRLYTESLGLALAIHLLGRYKAPVTLRRGLSRLQVRRLTAHIENNLDQDLSLAQLAAVVNLSGSHFKTVFKRSMGVAVHEYVIQRRVARAKELFETSELPASQIALAAGFSHQSHMARSMRRLLGVTPRAIARRC